MRGPRLKTPLLLLLLLLLTSLTGTALCQEDDGTEPENGVEEGEEEEPNVEPADYVTTDIPATNPSLTDISETDQADESQEYQGSGHPTEIDEIHVAGGTTTTEYPNVTDWTSVPVEEEGLSPIIILIPVVLVVLIIGMIVCGIFINRRWNKKARNQELSKEDPYLDGSSTEKVPMPMFEEDVPSVLELEMEELDQWMKKDGGAEGDSKQT